MDNRTGELDDFHNSLETDGTPGGSRTGPDVPTKTEQLTTGS